MRILAAADIHGIQPVYDWLMKLTRTSVDVLVLAGDLLEGDVASEQRKQAKKLVTRLRASLIPVLYIMGNDDNVPLNYEDKLVQPLHGRRIEMGSYNFVGYQYTPPFVGDAFVKPEEEIEFDLRLLEPLLDERTVLVTHAPALGTLDMVFEANVGSRSIADLLRRRPVLAHIHGHVHSQFGRDGNHFNAASAGVCRAILIEVPSLQYTLLNDTVPAQ